MADGPNDFRDPKVTTRSATPATPGGGIGKWIAIAVAAVLALLLLLWLLGLFGDDDAVVPGTAGVGTTDDSTVVVTD